jgi:hypothetical protein
MMRRNTGKLSLKQALCNLSARKARKEYGQLRLVDCNTAGTKELRALSAYKQSKVLDALAVNNGCPDNEQALTTSGGRR